RLRSAVERRPLPDSDIPAIVPAGLWCHAVLGSITQQPAYAGGTGRGECRRSRPAVGGTLRSGMDQRHPRSQGFGPGPGCPDSVDGLETATLAGGTGRRVRRLGVELAQQLVGDPFSKL